MAAAASLDPPKRERPSPPPPKPRVTTWMRVSRAWQRERFFFTKLLGVTLALTYSITIAVIRLPFSIVGVALLPFRYAFAAKAKTAAASAPAMRESASPRSQAPSLKGVFVRTDNPAFNPFGFSNAPERRVGSRPEDIRPVLGRMIEDYFLGSTATIGDIVAFLESLEDRRIGTVASTKGLIAEALRETPFAHYAIFYDQRTDMRVPLGHPLILRVSNGEPIQIDGPLNDFQYVRSLASLYGKDETFSYELALALLSRLEIRTAKDLIKELGLLDPTRHIEYQFQGRVVIRDDSMSIAVDDHERKKTIFLPYSEESKRWLRDNLSEYSRFHREYLIHLWDEVARSREGAARTTVNAQNARHGGVNADARPNASTPVNREDFDLETAHQMGAPLNANPPSAKRHPNLLRVSEEGFHDVGRLPQQSLE